MPEIVTGQIIWLNSMFQSVTEEKCGEMGYKDAETGK